MIFDLLTPVSVIPVGAKMPDDARARSIAERPMAEPADDRTLGEFAIVVAASERTLARLWSAETGLGFGRWRTQVRLAAALALLAEGMPLAGIAHRVGYASASAFVAAFHREVGVSPGRYFAATD